MNDEKEFTPIKNFWSTALINATFFEINDKDKKILEYFKDICFIPLDYPSFKIEFRFEPNEYMKETTLIKTFYFVENEKNELKNVEGCKINWLDDEKNPTIKLTTRKKKKGKSREIINSFLRSASLVSKILPQRKLTLFLIFLILKTQILEKN